jgi:hypothetical protein
MSGLGITLTGDRQVILRFENFPQFARARLLETMQGLEVQLLAAVQSLEPKGKTGELRARTSGTVFNDPAQVKALVGVRVPGAKALYPRAAALNYGSHRSIVVRKHEAAMARLTRRMSGEMSPVYTRMTNIHAQQFLQRGLDMVRPAAVPALRAAIEAAIQDGGG